MGNNEHAAPLEPDRGAIAIGDWDEADRLSATALRGITSSFQAWLLIIRADVEIGRGDFDAARAHLEAGSGTPREDRVLGLYDAYVADLALWERRWADADAAVHVGLAQARTGETVQIRVQLCAKGLRARAELAALARARRDADALRDRLDRARKLLTVARRAGAEASAITPNVAGWLALAEAEHERARGVARADLWSDAADTWHRLERPPLVAYCRWRHAEALVTAGAARRRDCVAQAGARDRSSVGRAAPAARARAARRAGAARSDAPGRGSGRSEAGPGGAHGLTPREAEVLALVARGLTDREVAAELVISVKTASVHVSHILRKLDAPNRLEAAAIVHRIASD